MRDCYLVFVQYYDHTPTIVQSFQDKADAVKFIEAEFSASSDTDYAFIIEGYSR